MRMSKMFLQTTKENSKEADVISNKLMMRAGLIKKLVSGVYSYLPLGLKVLRNIENIVRDEMNKSGAQEILCSALQPRELWDQSGRWDKYGSELVRLKDRNEREFCLGPTHEEIFTDIVRERIKSYKQLPFNLYQIQTKYRDEKRPRFGLIRGREFLMKDAYSFNATEEGLDKEYEVMYDTYQRIFDRCGLNSRPVLADTGAIGGDNSHQYMALSDIGESEIIYCDKCDYAADQEKASYMLHDVNNKEELKEMKEIETKGVQTINQLVEYLDIDIRKTVKSVVYMANDKPVLVLVRGDREVNEIKFCNVVGISEEEIEFASEKVLKQVLNTEKGYMGPVGLDCEILVDREIKNMINFYVGANKENYHLMNVNYGRDFEGKLIDIRNTEAGDKCPKCGSVLKSQRGIEVGQIFKLGTKYSESMNCVYVAEDGKEKPMVMGCYGIGISRTLASIIEQHNDEFGIIWPMSVAPYKVYIVLIDKNNEEQSKVADMLYENLIDKGIETILDDRKERPGVKFKDCDLIGIPIRITIGKKIVDNIVEYKLRKEDNYTEINIDEVIDIVEDEIKKATN